MSEIQESKNKLVTMLSRVIPGTTSIDNCKHLEYCIDRQIRKCGDIKKLCVMCIEKGNVIGGIAFPFGLKLGNDLESKNPIFIYRYGQSDRYITGIEGKGFEDLIEKFEKEPEIKRITERTQFIKDERKEFEDLSKIEAFKRSNATVLIVRRNKQGEYEEIDKKLMNVAREKEKETGIKIKIIDENDIVKNVYLLGIDNKELVKKLEIDVESLQNIDDRIFLLVSQGNYNGKYEGVLAINSIDDDIFGENVEKDRMKEYFMNKYEGLTFICMDTFCKRV
jgi:hypothetical protein